MTHGTTFIIIYTAYLFLTELFPFACLVYSMVKRLKVYQKARKILIEHQKSQRSSTETSAAQSLMSLGIEDMTYTTDVNKLLRG